MSTGSVVVSLAIEGEKGFLCGALDAAAEGTREKDLEDPEDRIRSLCAKRCQKFVTGSSTPTYASSPSRTFTRAFSGSRLFT